MDRKKALELDKICRVCISERKEMRPLFSEKVPEMLMDCTSVRVEPIEGWPDKICVQCVHAVSRNHAFKTLVERSDKELREYIKSITVSVLMDDEDDLKRSEEQLLEQQAQLQKQQQLEEEERELQQRFEQQQLEKQQKKQQKIIQKQIRQQQLEEQQHKLHKQQMHQQLLQEQQQQLQQTVLLVQQQQEKKAKLLARQKARQTKKQQTLQQPQQLQQTQQCLQQVQPITTVTTATHHLQQQQHQQQQQQQQQHHHQQQQQQQQIQQHQQVQQQQQQQVQQQQQQRPQLQQTQQLISTATAMPQQILLPNGQIITTAQIVTPQITQIIGSQPTTSAGLTTNTNPNVSSTITTQTQYVPQLIQTSTGQTLQIIQQPNGTQTLQLVQLVPQRTLNNATTTTDMTALNENDVQLIDEGEEDELDDMYEHIDNKHQAIETIVLEDDTTQLHQQHQQHHHVLKDNEDIIDEEDLTQSETQELEYLEDITITTSTHHQHNDDEMPEQLLHDECEEDEDENEDIIEEIHMEEEMLEDDSGGSVIHVMEASLHGLHSDNCEYITDDHQPTTQHLVDEDCVDELHYTVMEDEDDCEADVENALVEADVHEVFQAACGITTNIQTAELHQTATLSVSPAKKPRRSNNKSNASNSTAKLAAANTRQLAATASVIASAGADDDYEIDAKLITDFIQQQTTPLGLGRYICNLCNTEFKQFKGLQNHMHSHTNWIRANCKKQPQCEICLKSFKGPGMLRMHMKTHDAETSTPVCNICGKTFKSKAILYRHRQTHQQRAYSCGVQNCRKAFSTAINLRTHMERKHAETAQPKFKCSECNALFECVDLLQSHVDITCHGNGSLSGTAPHDIATAATADTAVIVGDRGEVFFVTQT